ncbi:DUF2854 domain-containing protein [Brasilonema octagenarum]|uniref:DUF2854 domain-containing protein n=1 Tax=Brasilonema octagenarum UFV-OR1 TaxID=417115 RepID=A0ABX1MKT0_9CYAN|nr:DUF2854 domain-containing protein [Brasilonema octagenarum]NMF67329.1 hypothetical protein [Brasilonema octagenarum UFV-OR1]
MLGQISLGTLGITIGGVLTIIGFAAYAADNATLNLIGFFYGIPLLLGGLALKANELKPVPLSKPTTPQMLTLREKQGTPTQNKIRQDITRFRYGQDVHLYEALSFLKLGSTDDDIPVVTQLQETEINGAYALILKFDSPAVPIEVWQKKQEKMTSFFGPGVEVKVTQPESEKIDLTLIATEK